MKECFVSRIEVLRKSLADNGIDAAIVSSESSLRALTGYGCDNGYLLVDGKSAVFYTDFRYEPEIRRTVPWVKIGDISGFSKGRRFPKAARYGKIGVEFSMPHSNFLLFSGVFPGAEFSDITPVLSRIRAVKNRCEISAVKKAAALNDRIWTCAKKVFRPGMTEKDLARKIKLSMVSRGDGEAFQTIVAYGKNAAECHHIPDDTVMDGKNAILVDLGVKCDGFCSDMTRNIAAAKPSSLYRNVYSRVLEANMAAIEAARPGITCGELDGVARRHLARCGFDRHFRHSLGHGVGIDIHEFPTVSKKSDTVLMPGMFVTIEPGVYMEGKLGVRIEDLVLITEDGCEVVSKSSKMLEV